MGLWGGLSAAQQAGGCMLQMDAHVSSELRRMAGRGGELQRLPELLAVWRPHAFPSSLADASTEVLCLDS